MAAVAETALEENEVNADPHKAGFTAMSSFWKS
jgi:hypothetical protein